MGCAVTAHPPEQRSRCPGRRGWGWSWSPPSVSPRWPLSWPDAHSQPGQQGSVFPEIKVESLKSQQIDFETLLTVFMDTLPELIWFVQSVIRFRSRGRLLKDDQRIVILLCLTFLIWPSPEELIISMLIVKMECDLEESAFIFVAPVALLLQPLAISASHSAVLATGCREMSWTQTM